MSGRMVRKITKVKDVNKLADYVTSDNDIITDVSILFRRVTNGL